MAYCTNSRPKIRRAITANELTLKPKSVKKDLHLQNT